MAPARSASTPMPSAVNLAPPPRQTSRRGRYWALTGCHGESPEGAPDELTNAMRKGGMAFELE
jgi:hypothetical protein